MRKGRIFISALLIAAMSTSLLACSSKDKSSVYSRELDSAVREEIHQNAADSDLLTGDKLENGVIKWLSDWDINPDSTGKNVPTDLAVFQERYGGSVKYYPCTYTNRYEKLTEYISSDEGIDFFYGGNLDAFPKGAIKKMFVPVDDYIDFESPLWEDVKDVNDQFIWQVFRLRATQLPWYTTERPSPRRVSTTLPCSMRTASGPGIPSRVCWRATLTRITRSTALTAGGSSSAL